MTTTIGLVLPVAGAATKMFLDDSAYKTMEEELSLAEKSIEFSIKGSDISIDWFEKNDAPDLEYNQEYGGSIRAQGSMLRQLHSILKEKDPHFGGLERVQDKQRKFLWVHPQFIGEY